VAWLSDVAPDGTSAQVSAGVRNLTHRDSDAKPTPLEPGRAYEVRVPMRAAGYRFAAGHRMRLSFTSSYWPVLWPSPFACDITLLRGGEAPSRLILPVIPPAGGDGDLPVPAFGAAPRDVMEIGGDSEEPRVWRIVDDVIAGTVVVEVSEGGTTVLPDGRELYAGERLTMTASDADPARARLDTRVVYRWREHDFATEIVAEGTIASDAEAFAVDLDLRVTVDGEAFFGRQWHESVPRDLL
jgi:hypothetical protein